MVKSCISNRWFGWQTTFFFFFCNLRYHKIPWHLCCPNGPFKVWIQAITSSPTKLLLSVALLRYISQVSTITYCRYARQTLYQMLRYPIRYKPNKLNQQMHPIFANSNSINNHLITNFKISTLAIST